MRDASNQALVELLTRRFELVMNDLNLEGGHRELTATSDLLSYAALFGRHRTLSKLLSEACSTANEVVEDSARRCAELRLQIEQLAKEASQLGMGPTNILGDDVFGWHDRVLDAIRKAGSFGEKLPDRVSVGAARTEAETQLEASAKAIRENLDLVRGIGAHIVLSLPKAQRDLGRPMANSWARLTHLIPTHLYRLINLNGELVTRIYVREFHHWCLDRLLLDDVEAQVLRDYAEQVMRFESRDYLRVTNKGNNEDEREYNRRIALHLFQRGFDPDIEVVQGPARADGQFREGRRVRYEVKVVRPQDSSPTVRERLIDEGLLQAAPYASDTGQSRGYLIVFWLKPRSEQDKHVEFEVREQAEKHNVELIPVYLTGPPSTETARARQSTTDA